MWAINAGIDVTEFTYRDGCLVEHVRVRNTEVGVRWNNWSLSSRNSGKGILLNKVWCREHWVV